jgi:hypothetical protein
VVAGVDRPGAEGLVPGGLRVNDPAAVGHDDAIVELGDVLP